MQVYAFIICNGPYKNNISPKMAIWSMMMTIECKYEVSVKGVTQDIFLPSREIQHMIWTNIYLHIYFSSL